MVEIGTDRRDGGRANRKDGEGAHALRCARAAHGEAVAWLRRIGDGDGDGVRRREVDLIETEAGPGWGTSGGGRSGRAIGRRGGGNRQGKENFDLSATG